MALSEQLNFDLCSKDVRMSEDNGFRSNIMNKHLKKNHEIKVEMSQFNIFYHSQLRAK